MSDPKNTFLGPPNAAIRQTGFSTNIDRINTSEFRRRMSSNNVRQPLNANTFLNNIRRKSASMYNPHTRTRAKRPSRGGRRRRQTHKQVHRRHHKT